MKACDNNSTTLEREMSQIWYKLGVF